MLAPPHCLHWLLWRLCLLMPAPPCSHFCGGCARRCLPRRIACTCFCGCARRCLTRHIACNRSLCGCARRCSPLRIACTCFFRGCARRCFSHCIACSCFLCGSARKCLVHCIAWTSILTHTPTALLVSRVSDGEFSIYSSWLQTRIHLQSQVAEALGHIGSSSDLHSCISQEFLALA
jgi:hypothetical protein